MVTRSCLGVWDFMTGHLLFKLNNSALGAIITHGLVNEVSEQATIAGLCGFFCLCFTQVTYMTSGWDIHCGCRVRGCSVLGHEDKTSRLPREAAQHPANILLQKSDSMHCHLKVEEMFLGLFFEINVSGRVTGVTMKVLSFQDHSLRARFTGSSPTPSPSSRILS